MDDVQEFGHSLDLVQHDRRSAGRAPHEIGQPLRPRRELARHIGLEEVDDERLREHLAEPRRLAGPPGTEQEEALTRRFKKSTL
jgi:hypothetical protein